MTRPIRSPRTATLSALQGAGDRKCWRVLPLVLPMVLIWCWLGASGCAPPGPNAVLRGKRALDERRFPEAVKQLERATQLLPKNAFAWNYLGLAYHGSQQPEPAMKAYRTALALDHKLSAVRYNLGCLYLEQNQLAPAIDEFRSYSLLQPVAVEGWVRLGTALLRARRLDEAERSFRTSLELQPRHPEALNGLGLIQMYRRRWQEAVNHFNVAALQDPPFPPAVLNSALVAHQYLHQRSTALQRYRQYLALQPRPADADAVETIVRNLEGEGKPPLALGANVPASAPPRSPAPAPPTPNQNATPGSPPAPAPRASPAAAPTALASAPTVARTNPAPSSVARANPGSVSATNVLTAASRPAPEPARPSTRTVPPKPVVPPAVKPAEIEVAQVPPELVIKPPQELARSGRDTPGSASSSSTPASAAPLVNDPAALSGRGGTNSGKKGFFSRLNPFAGNSKTAGSEAGDNVGASGVAGTGSGSASETGPARPVARYNYLSPVAPTPGSRVEAEKDFKRGLRAQKGGHRAQAIADYQAALRNDPAYYDAYYNLGLAALENGEAPLSLWAYEIALALRTDSEDARYNFALALKAGGYWLDAVEELKRILAASPASARSHLSLANLYSQQLRQPQAAREHYERLLELNPRHPEAPKIRFWLAANP